MWRWSVFAPAGALLLLLAWVALARRDVTSRKHVAYLTLGLALLAWLSIVLPLRAPFFGSDENHDFVAQRDIGYFIGSFIFVCATFALVAALGIAGRRFNLGKVATGLSALVLAATGFLFVPGLFATGWIVGCVFAGYSSCM
jgi:hypothetical protein